MSLIFIDGFDHYATADIAKKWSATTGSPTINASGGRRGGGCLSAAGTASVIRTVVAGASFVMGAAIDANVSSTPVLFGLYDAGTVQCDLRVNIDGTLSVTRSGAALTGGTSTQTLTAGYHYIEWKVTIADSIGANTCKVRVDGIDWITVAAGQDLKSTANASANQVKVGSPSGGSSLFDDFYLCDQGGSTNNDFLGDVRVDAVYPTSDGANSAWAPSTGTTHYTLVDEAAPNTTDYVESGTVAQKDTYGMGDISHTPASIFGAQVSIAALKDDAGVRLIKPVTRSGGTDYSGASQALSQSQVYYLEVRETDPATSAAWTKTGFNAAEFGVECA